MNLKILYHIVSLIVKDADLVSFSMANRFISSIVFGGHSPLWRSRFTSLYDNPINKDNDEMRDTYVLRSACVRLAQMFTCMEDVFLTALLDVALGKSSSENAAWTRSWPLAPLTPKISYFSKDFTRTARD